MTKIYDILQKIEAIKLVQNPEEYFTWASGLRSPIYCDNRKLISFPKERTYVVSNFVEYIKKNHTDVELIAGTATAGIPWASWIAQELNLPMAYIRSGSKSHGLQKSIEGDVRPGTRAILIEDLISTGGSAINAVKSLRNADANLLIVLSIFSYNLPIARENFLKESISYNSLADFDGLIEQTKMNAAPLLSWRDTL